MLKASEISEIIAERIKHIELGKKETAEFGRVLSVQDGIVRVYGLDLAFYEEYVEIETKSGKTIGGLVTNLEADNLCVLALSDERLISEGDRVRRTKQRLKVPVGRGLLGRVVDALGKPIDGLGPIENVDYDFIEKPAPGIMGS